jgi:Uma2 family endonuclease
MSAAPRQFETYCGLRMTAEEYLAIGPTSERYELINGLVVMSPSPTSRHQKIVMLLIRQIDRHVEAHGGELLPDVDLRLAPDLVYRPDLVYYRPGTLVGLPDPLTLAPDLVVEVLSRGTRALDLNTKREDYGRFGAREYWVVDPDSGAVRCWRRDDRNRFVEVPVAADQLVSTAIAGFSLNLPALRRGATG